MKTSIPCKILSGFILCMGCFTFCIAKDGPPKLSVEYDYVTAATYFPIPSLENNSKYFIFITDRVDTDSLTTVKVLITPGDVIVTYSIDKNGIIWDAQAEHQAKTIFSVSLKRSRGELFPTHLFGNWPDDIESIILGGLRYFSVGSFLLHKKTNEKIVLQILSTSFEHVKLQIDNTIAEYHIRNGVKKMRLYESQNEETQSIGELTLFNEYHNSKLDGMLLSYEFKSIQPSLVYYAPLKLKRLGYLYVKDNMPYVRVYNTAGRVIQDDIFSKVKPFLTDYWPLETEE